MIRQASVVFPESLPFPAISSNCGNFRMPM
jgi:hypothetical protein